MKGSMIKTKAKATETDKTGNREAIK
jgi:hypothetical protein